MNRQTPLIRIGGMIIAATLLSACQTVTQPPAVPEVIEAEPVAVEKSATEQAAAKPVDPAEQLYKLALWSARAGKNEEAIQQFSQVIDINPAYKKALTNLGLLLLQLGDYQAAREALNRAIEQDNSDAIAYNHLAIIQRNEGAFQQALENYRKAIDANPDYANAHLNLGILLDIYIQDLPAALQQYETFQRLSEGDNEQVEKWIVDIKQRIDKSRKN